jgi:two-component system, LytTR family, sensor kinase
MKPLTKRGAFSLPLQVLLWAAGSSAAGAVVGLVVGLFREIDGRLLLMSLLFGNVVGLTVFVCSVALYPVLRNIAPLGRYLVLAVGLLAGSMAGTALVGLVFRWFVLANPSQSLAVFALNAVLALIVGGLAHAYEGMRWRLAESLREVEEVRLVGAELHEQAARAELAALQARINPHFFFNTLNTISALLGEDPAKADEVVQTLADLFRYTFKAAHADAVTLSEELEFVEGYLAVEKARFGDRLKVAWAVTPEARIARVPGLILQPLVENAVGHGIAPSPGGGTVRISGRVEGGNVVVEVEDDGVGLKSDAAAMIREDHGLGNVRKRVATASRGEGAMELLPAARGRGTLARIVLPFVPASAAAIRERTA